MPEDVEGADSEELELSVCSGRDELGDEGGAGVDDEGRKGKRVRPGRRGSRIFRLGDGRRRENGARPLLARPYCVRPGFGLVEGQGRLVAAVELVGVEMEDLLARAREGSSREPSRLRSAIHCQGRDARCWPGPRRGKRERERRGEGPASQANALGGGEAYRASRDCCRPVPQMMASHVCSARDSMIAWRERREERRKKVEMAGRKEQKFCENLASGSEMGNWEKKVEVLDGKRYVIGGSPCEMEQFAAPYRPRLKFRQRSFASFMPSLFLLHQPARHPTRVAAHHTTWTDRPSFIRCACAGREKNTHFCPPVSTAFE